MKRRIIFICLTIVSTCLIVGGFFVPPLGIIDGSVLQSVGELLAFGVVSMIPDIIKSTKTAKVTTSSGTTIEFDGREKDKQA